MSCSACMMRQLQMSDPSHADPHVCMQVSNNAVDGSPLPDEKSHANGVPQKPTVRPSKPSEALVEDQDPSQGEGEPGDDDRDVDDAGSRRGWSCAISLSYLRQFYESHVSGFVPSAAQWDAWVQGQQRRQEAWAEKMRERQKTATMPLLDTKQQGPAQLHRPQRGHITTEQVEYL